MSQIDMLQVEKKKKEITDFTKNFAPKYNILAE